MPQVMDPGLISSEIVACDSGMSSEPPEAEIHRLHFDRLRRFGLKHVLAGGVTRFLLRKVLGKKSANVRSHRHQSGFVKFGLLNPDDGAGQVDMTVFKAQCFAQT